MIKARTQTKIQTEPFGYSIIGKWQKGRVIRFCITHLRSIPINENNLYICTPHTFCSKEQLREVKNVLVDKGCCVFIESLWTGFTRHCEAEGFRCIPSYYELGISLSFPALQKVVYPLHFGRSVLYDSLVLKGFDRLEPFFKEQFLRNETKVLFTAGEIKAPIQDFTKNRPWLTIQSFPASLWVEKVLTQVGCNITATETDAGPRLFTYSARMGINTVFLRKRIGIRMGEPIPLLKDFAFIAEDDSYETISETIKKAIKGRGTRALIKDRIIKEIVSQLTIYGYPNTIIA